MLEVTVDICKTGVLERWEIVIGNVYYSLYSDIQLTPTDARLQLIIAFGTMQVKNGYGFGSTPPNRVWSYDF